MPYTGATFNLLTNDNYPAVEGEVIDPDPHNSMLEDLAAGLTAAVTRDGAGSMSGDLNMGSHKLTGLSAGSANGHSVRYEQVQLATAFATAWEGASWAAGKMGYATSSSAVALIDTTAAGRAALNFTDPNADRPIYFRDSDATWQPYTFGTGFTFSAGALSLDTDLQTWAGVTPGTGVATALAVNVGSAGAIVVNGGALGTPSSGTLSSCTGLPISTGVSGLGSNVAAWLADPTSAKLAAALTNETGSGVVVFDTSPSMTTPTIAGATLSGTIATGTSTVTGTPTFNGGPIFSISTNPVVLSGSQGPTYSAELFHSIDGAHDVLEIRSRGGAGGWSGGADVQTSNNAGSLTTQMKFRNNGGTPTVEVTNGTIHGRATISSETSGTLSAVSANKQVNASGDITLNDGVFTAGDRGEIYAGGSARTITQDTGMTLRLDGTSTTGNRSLAARGRLSWYCVSSTEIVVSGMGVT